MNALVEEYQKALKTEIYLRGNLSTDDNGKIAADPSEAKTDGEMKNALGRTGLSSEWGNLQAKIPTERRANSLYRVFTAVDGDGGRMGKPLVLAWYSGGNVVPNISEVIGAKGAAYIPQTCEQTPISAIIRGWICETC